MRQCKVTEDAIAKALGFDKLGATFATCKTCGRRFITGVGEAASESCGRGCDDNEEDHIPIAKID